MRTIKFRAWYLKANEMLNNERLGSLHMIGVFCNKDYKNVYNFMQFTGLLDKNGIEIYEGDILRKTNGNYKLGKVIFDNAMFCFESIGCGIYTGSDAFNHIHSLHYKEYDSFNNYEVIGNIYKHPSLLEVNND